MSSFNFWLMTIGLLGWGFDFLFDRSTALTTATFPKKPHLQGMLIQAVILATSKEQSKLLADTAIGVLSNYEYSINPCYSRWRQR
jgi:hypothetical protein